MIYLALTEKGYYHVLSPKKRRAALARRAYAMAHNTVHALIYYDAKFYREQLQKLHVFCRQYDLDPNHYLLRAFARAYGSYLVWEQTGILHDVDREQMTRLLEAAKRLPNFDETTFKRLAQKYLELDLWKRVQWDHLTATGEFLTIRELKRRYKTLEEANRALQQPEQYRQT